MAKQESRPWWGPDPKFNSKPNENQSAMSGMAWLHQEEGRIIQEELQKTRAEASGTGETTEVPPNSHWYEKYLPNIVVKALFSPQPENLTK
jgi:hypothetical protein